MQLQWYTQLKQHPHVPMARPPGLTGVCFSNVDWLRIWESQKLRLHGLLLDLGRVNTLSSSRGQITYNCLPVSGQLPNNGPVAMQTHFSASLVSHPINVGISIFAPFWVSKLVAVRRVLRKVWCKNPAWLFPRWAVDAPLAAFSQLWISASEAPKLPGLCLHCPEACPPLPKGSSPTTAAARDPFRNSPLEFIHPTSQSGQPAVSASLPKWA